MHGMTSGDSGEMADVFIFLICLFLIVILMLDIKTELSVGVLYKRRADMVLI